MRTVASLLLVFAHYTYIKVSFVSVSSLLAGVQIHQESGNGKTKFFARFFFSSHSFSVLIKNTHTPILLHHRFSSFLRNIISILGNQKEKKRKQENKTTYRQTDIYAGATRREEKKEREKVLNDLNESYSTEG